MLVFGHLSLHQHGAQQNEVTEFGVYHVAVYAHVAEAGSDGDGLMRDDPDFSGPDAIHLHRKTHWRIRCPNAPITQH